MNFLVLGGNGFIGSHLVDKLLQEGHAVRVFDKHEEHYRKPLTGVEYGFGEFGNRSALAEALKEIDVVFHLISTTLPKTSNDDPAYDVKSNVIESIYLLEKCVENKVKKIVYASSGGTVYGIPRGLPVSEDHSTNPLCSYGICKLTIEKYLELFKILYGLDYVVLRPSNPYGERQNPLGIQGAVSVFLGKVARNETIEIWGDGEIVRDYIYVHDLVEGMYSSALINTPSNVFNLGSGTGISLNKLLAIIRDIVECDLKVKYSRQRTFDVPAIYLDITKAQKELLWRPITPIELGLKKTWEFILKTTL